MCISRLLIAHAEARLSLPPLRGKPWVNRHEKTRSWIGADRRSEARYAVIATPRALRQISASGNACDDYGLEVRFESKVLCDPELESVNGCICNRGGMG